MIEANELYACCCCKHINTYLGCDHDRHGVTVTDVSVLVLRPFIYLAPFDWIEMTSLAFIELRPIIAADSIAIADADDDEDDVVTVNSTEIGSILVSTASSPPSPTMALKGDETNNVTSKRHIRTKYLTMIMVAYSLTLISPGTILWSSSSSFEAAASIPLCDPSAKRYNNASAVDRASYESSSMAMLTSVNTTFNDNPTSNENDEMKYNNTDESDILDKRAIVKATESKINIPLMMKLTTYTIVLMGLFFNLQGSDPGSLDKEALSLLGDDKHANDNIHAINDNTKCMDCGEEEEDKRKGEMDIEQQLFLGPSSLTSSSTEAGDYDSSQSSMLQCHQRHPPMVSMPRQQFNRGYCYPRTRRKYCHLCKIHPPIRSHHCNICQACVATFDHHCVFLGTCIGERNHFRFWFFVLWNVLCFHLVWGIVNSGRVVSRFGENNVSSIASAFQSLLGYHHDEYEAGALEDDSITRQIRIGQATLFIAKLYMYPLYSIAILLLMVHTIHAVGNSTTFELTKGPEHIDYLANTNMMDFPFGKGVFNNIHMFIMRDDSSVWFLFWRRPLKRRDRLADGIDHVETKVATATKSNVNDVNEIEWLPTVWKMPTCIDRDSEDWWNHPWSNKYWSCC